MTVREIRLYGAHSIQIHRRLRAMHSHLLDIADGEIRGRVQTELDLLDLDAADFSPHDRALAREPDRFGIGGV